MSSRTVNWQCSTSPCNDVTVSQAATSTELDEVASSCSRTYEDGPVMWRTNCKKISETAFCACASRPFRSSIDASNYMDTFASCSTISPLHTSPLAIWRFSKLCSSLCPENRESATLLRRSKKSSLHLSSCKSPSSYVRAVYSATLRMCLCLSSDHIHVRSSALSPQLVFFLEVFSNNTTRARTLFASLAKPDRHCTFRASPSHFAAKESCF